MSQSSGYLSCLGRPQTWCCDWPLCLTNSRWRCHHSTAARSTGWMSCLPPSPKASERVAAVEAAEALEVVAEEAGDWSPCYCRRLLRTRSPQSQANDSST